MGYGSDTPEKIAGMQSLNLDWWYNWDSDINPGGEVIGEYVPMLYSKTATRLTRLNSDLSANVVATGKPNPALLGFNEPDLSGQANMTPMDALNTWAPMMSTGLRLGSPVAVSPAKDWMSQFMGATNALDTGKAEIDKGFRVDFVTAHIYQDPSVNNFLSKIDALHDLWGKPVWVTETAVADFTAVAGSGVKSTRYTRAQVEQYMKDLWVELQKRPWLERFAWKTRSNTDEQMWFSSVFNSNFSRTSTGVVYANLT